MSAGAPRASWSRAARTLVKRALEGVVRGWTPRVDLPLSTWRLTRDADGALELGGRRLDGLFAQWGSPLYVVDEMRLRENAARFTARPEGAAHGCEVFASYKTNPVPGVLRTLHECGLGAEVTSAWELWLARRLGVAPERIIFNGPARTDEALAEGIASNVGLINLNTRSELVRADRVARQLGRRARVGLRVVPPGGAGGQFGERIDTGAALEAFREALQQPHLDVLGVHAHYNGRIDSAPQLSQFVGALLAFVDELQARLGLRVQILDVGGNLACPTVHTLSRRDLRLAQTFAREPTPPPVDEVLSIDRYVEGLVRPVEAHFAALGQPPPRLFVEPGRALMGNTQLLLCRVASVRDVDEAGVRWAILDAGINVAEPMTSEFHQLFALVEPRGPGRQLYRLTGPTCTQADCLYPAWRLPKLRPGDGLAIMDAGAYFVPSSTCFSHARPGVVALGDGAPRPLLRPETFEDLVSRDEPGAVLRALHAVGGGP